MSADFLLYHVSKGKELNYSCEPQSTDLYPTRGFYEIAIPLSCANGGVASTTQYINYDD